MKKQISALACAVIASASVGAGSLQLEALPSAGATGQKVLAKPEVKLTGYGHSGANGGGTRQAARSQEPTPSSTPEPESLALALLAIAVLGGKRLRGSRNS